MMIWIDPTQMTINQLLDFNAESKQIYVVPYQTALLDDLLLCLLQATF